MLDSTRSMVTNTWTGASSVAFNVLGAYGYPVKGGGRPRVWSLAAYHRATHVEWEDFLRQLDTSTAPVLVISDGVDEIRNAVSQVWPGAAGTLSPFVLRCEHHLRVNAREDLQADGVALWGSSRMATLNDAFRSPEGWTAFKATVRRKQAHAYQWVQANHAQVLAQVNARPHLPEHYSTAALDAPSPSRNGDSDGLGPRAVNFNLMPCGLSTTGTTYPVGVSSTRQAGLSDLFGGVVAGQRRGGRTRPVCRSRSASTGRIHRGPASRHRILES